LVLNEKIRRFVSDSDGIQHDSIIEVYGFNELPNSTYDVVGALISAKRYTEAASLIDALNADGPSNFTFCKLQQFALDLAKTPKIVEQWQTDNGMKNYLITLADGLDFRTQGLAASLLEIIYGIRLPEERLEPIEPNNGSRLINNINEVDANRINLADGISVYPNPANDVLTVKLETERTEAAIIKIVDVAGKVLIEQACTNNCSIKLNTLQNGIYFVNLFNNTVLVSTKKIVVIK
jgi:hypothetical protein